MRACLPSRQTALRTRHLQCVTEQLLSDVEGSRRGWRRRGVCLLRRGSRSQLGAIARSGARCGRALPESAPGRVQNHSYLAREPVRRDRLLQKREALSMAPCRSSASSAVMHEPRRDCQGSGRYAGPHAQDVVFSDDCNASTCGWSTRSGRALRPQGRRAFFQSPRRTLRAPQRHRHDEPSVRRVSDDCVFERPFGENTRARREGDRHRRSRHAGRQATPANGSCSAHRGSLRAGWGCRGRG